MSRNYFHEMSSGLYNIKVARVALYHESASNDYIKTRVMNDYGEMITLEDEYISTAITILTMIEIYKKGYPIEISNPKKIKEITEILYGHIGLCVDIKNDDPLGRYPVPEMDLIDMEEFMVAIVENNPSTLMAQFADDLRSRLKVTGMVSMFEDDVEIVATKNDVDKYRRVTDVRVGDLSISDLLNTL